MAGIGVGLGVAKGRRKSKEEKQQILGVTYICDSTQIKQKRHDVAELTFIRRALRRTCRLRRRGGVWRGCVNVEHK